MKRRSFLTHTGLAGILAAGSAPAFAQGAPEVKWRLASSFPKSLDTIYGGAVVVSETVAAATNNKFQIQVFAGGEIVPPFGVVDAVHDAAEWVGPYDDEKLGFYKVAKFYYYPGWWEGGPEIDLFVNTKAYADLPKDYQAILEAACHKANVDMVAKYDALNPDALKRLLTPANQVKLLPFPPEVMAACYKATQETYDEVATKNDKFKKI